MNRQETINELRALADMLEKAPDATGRISVTIDVFELATRSELAGWVGAVRGNAFAQECYGAAWIRVDRSKGYSKCNLFYAPGLLSRTVEKVTESVTITETPAELLAAESITPTPNTGATDGND